MQSLPPEIKEMVFKYVDAQDIILVCREWYDFAVDIFPVVLENKIISRNPRRARILSYVVKIEKLEEKLQKICDVCVDRTIDIDYNIKDKNIQLEIHYDDWDIYHPDQYVTIIFNFSGDHILVDHDDTVQICKNKYDFFQKIMHVPFIESRIDPSHVFRIANVFWKITQAIKFIYVSS